MANPVIKVQRLESSARLPLYAHVGEFGDLAADVYSIEDAALEAGETRAIRTGLALEMPSTHGVLVEDRSGLAVRGLTTLAGVIDPGYRGELKIVMSNLSDQGQSIAVGERIAQLRVVQRIEAEFVEVGQVAEAPRGAGGFGSTGR